MFCNKCGQQLPVDAKFCGNCGASFASSSTNKASLKSDVTSGAKSGESNKKMIIILASIFGGLLVAVLALTIAAFAMKSNGTPIPFMNFGDSQEEKSPRQIAFDEIINEYEQSLSWYNSVEMYHDTSYKYYADNLKTYIKNMQRCYSHFASFNNVPEKYFIADVDDDGLVELIVVDRSQNYATYMFNDEYNSISYFQPGNNKNLKSINYCKDNDIDFNYFEPADMHVQLTGTIKITTAKQRAADPTAKCQIYNGESGAKERAYILTSSYMNDDRYVIFQLDDQVEFPIRQLESVFPHKIWSIIVAYERKDGASQNDAAFFSTWADYDGKHVTINMDLTKCSAPSGVTGYGEDISFVSTSDCVID